MTGPRLGIVLVIINPDQRSVFSSCITGLGRYDRPWPCEAKTPILTIRFPRLVSSQGDQPGAGGVFLRFPR